MGHGQPDWGGAAEKDFVHVSQDIAELAVRLGSPVRYHRSGNVLFVDGFEHGLAPWVQAHSASICDVVLTQETSSSGGVSAEFQLGTGAGSFASIQKPVPYVMPGKIGVSVAFAFTTYLKELQLGVTAYDGSKFWEYIILYDHVNGLLKYYVKTTGFVTLTSITNLVANSKYFHCLKFIVDTVNYEYGSVFFDQGTYVVPACDIVNLSSSAWPHIRVLIYATGNTTNDSKVYVDDVVITGEEY